MSVIAEGIDKLKARLTPNTPSSSGIPFFEQARHYYLTRKTPTFPLNIDIMTKSGCNASCVFCPSGKPFLKVSHGVMPDELYENIVDEAAKHRILRFAPFLQNEPLRDPKIHERVAYARKKLPRYSQVRLISNGALLTEEMGRNLIDAGLTKLIISIQSIEKDVYEETMRGLTFEQTMENVMQFVELKERLGKKNPDFEVWMVRTAYVEKKLKEHKDFWSSKGIKLKARKLNNQANPDLEQSMRERGDIPVDAWEYAQSCSIPFWRAWVTWTGDMILCCADWHRSTVLGNINESSIEEIWNGRLYKEHRDRMLSGDVSGTLCQDCKGVD
ncbi:MAG: radical SAM protein [Candidatus Latescibacteria bacterium]|jgi:MoaA/NifB/PqqE/SkfB family radical SAM enzyme|nr:radical SAM protein [Candidatus Latescibacterota bacterium]